MAKCHIASMLLSDIEFEIRERILDHFQMKKCFGSAIILLTVAAVYIFSHPNSVQSGDSGELVAAANSLLVPHPPGYPLWTWLNYFWIQVFSFGTPFGRASIFGILIALAAYGIVLKTYKKPTSGVIGVLCLAFSGLFWKYSIIPEVFILNILFAALIILVALRSIETNSSHREIYTALLPCVFIFGLTNHLTLIFLAPVVLVFWWQNKTRKSFYLGALLGTAAAFGLYVSLLGFQTENLNSWGRLQNLNDIFHHFLRSDYGTLTLQTGGAGSSYFHSLQILTVAMLEVCGLPLLILAYGWLRKQSAKSMDFLTIGCLTSLLLYVFVFVPMINFPAEGFGKDVMERFFILPIFLGVTTVCLVLDKLTWTDKETRALVILTASFVAAPMLLINKDTLNYSKNFIIEDYAKNYISALPKNKPTVVFIGSDTHMFALRYIQEVEKPEQQFYATTAALFVHPWTSEKIKNEWPSFQYDSEKSKNDKTVYLDELIDGNISNFNFSFNKSFNTEKYKTTYHPLGRLISLGKGINTEFTPVPNFRTKITSLASAEDKYDINRDLFSEYAYIYLTEAKIEFAQENKEKALVYLRKSTDLVPYCLPCVVNLCKLQGNSNCPSPTNIYNYY